MSRLGDVAIGFILGVGSVITTALAIDKYSETESRISTITNADKTEKENSNSSSTENSN